MKSVKKFISIALVLTTIFAFIPSTAYASEPNIQVRVVASGLEYNWIGWEPGVVPGNFSPVNASFSQGVIIAWSMSGDRHWSNIFINRYGEDAFDQNLGLLYANFSEGFATVNRGGNFGHIDRQGNVVHQFTYARRGHFSEGLAMVRTGSYSASGNAGYIDTAGRVVIPLIHNMGFPFSEGLARVIVVRDGRGYSRFIDRQGNLISTDEFWNARDFSEGRAAVQIPIPLQNSDLDAIVWGFIDTTGNVVIQPQYGNVSSFSEGLAAVNGGTGLRLNEQNAWVPAQEWGYIDRSGNVVIQFEFYAAGDFSEGLARVEKNDRIGFIDRTGALIIPFEWESHRDINDSTNGLYWFSRAHELDLGFRDGLAPVARDGRLGFIDRTGKVVVEPIYDFVLPFNEGLTAARNIDGTWSILEIVGFGGAAQVPPTTPTDQPSSWAVEQVNAAIAAGLVPQSLQSQYTQAATRAEFTALAVALYETVTGREIAGRMHFNDTNDINVQKMGYLGIVAGVGDGNFAPNSTLTREQAAVMLARLADVIGHTLPSSAPTFADNAQISSWAVDGVGQMQASGIMGGVGNNQFSPSGSYTREQSIVTMMRLFNLLGGLF